MRKLLVKNKSVKVTWWGLYNVAELELKSEDFDNLEKFQWPYKACNCGEISQLAVNSGVGSFFVYTLCFNAHTHTSHHPLVLYVG